MHIDIDIPSTLGGLALAFVFAWITSNMARSRNREPMLWGVLGFFFPCFAIIVLLLIGHGGKR